MEINKQYDNAVDFINYMCESGTPFSEVRKSLGEFSAVLFFLRQFEKYLKDVKQRVL